MANRARRQDRKGPLALGKQVPGSHRSIALHYAPELRRVVEGRAESSLHAVCTKFFRLVHAGPPRRRLRWPPSKVTHRGRCERVALVRNHPGVGHSLYVAAIHAHHVRLLSGGANTHNRHTRQEIRQELQRLRNRLDAVPTFQAHLIIPFHPKSCREMELKVLLPVVSEH